MALFLSLLFGSVGGVYVAYARREHSPLFLIVGVALIVYPYFFSSSVMIVVIGVALALVPLAERKGLF